MVAKTFLAAAAILICCGTTLQGECPDGKCDKSAECSTKCTAEGKCTGEKSCSAGECDKEKCSTEKCSDSKCCKGECAKGECNKSKISDELKVAVVKDEECCEKKKCSGSKCSAEKCSTGACSKTAACDKTACTKGECNLSQCTAGKCGDGACSITAGIGSMCETLKCAIVGDAKREFTVECTGGGCLKSQGECSTAAKCTTETCATTTCAAEPCDTWFCFEGNCSGGECNATCSTEVCDGLKCAVEACLTLTGGEVKITAGRTFPGTPVEVAYAGNELTAVSKCAQKCAGKCSKTAEGCAEKCSKSTCGTLACSTEKCTAGECSDNCSTAACSSEKCTTAKCSTEVCTTGECAGKSCSTACSKANCSKTACSTKTCSTTESTADQSELEAKLAALAELQREVETLRRKTGTPEQLTVNVKLVEVDLTRCRKLGFSFDPASPHMVTELNETIEKSPDFLTSLQKNGLANVVANPTLAVISGRPATFHAGGEFPVSKTNGNTEFKEFGTKVDVLAMTLGGDKVRVEIRPEFSEVSGECGPAPCPALSARRWDSSLVAELGTPFVLSSASERRVRSCIETDVTQNPPQQRTREEVCEIQYFAVVTVNSAESAEANASEVEQADFESRTAREEAQRAYEEALLADVVEEEYSVRVYPVADLQVWKVRPDGVEFDADLLVTFIKMLAPHDSWRTESDGVTVDESARGEIQAYDRNGSLVICQTEEGHQHIAEFLQHMRVEGLKKADARKAEAHAVQPASAVEPVSTEAVPHSKCSKGACNKGACSKEACSDDACKESKCKGATYTKSPVSTTVDEALFDDAAAETAPECTGECPESGDCPCLGGECTR